MSRREEYRDRRSRFRPEREPSPKRWRRDRERDERHVIERSYHQKNRAINGSDSSERLKGSKTEEDSMKPIDSSKAGSESKIEGASDPKEFARSKFYFQHDDQGRQDGRDHIRPENEKGRSELKESKSEEKSSEKMKEKKKDESAWRHDRYLDLVSDSKPINQRPSFTERRMKQPDSSSLNADKNEERKVYNYRFQRKGEGFGRGNRTGMRIGNWNRTENRNGIRTGNGNLGFRAGPIRESERFGGRSLEQRNEVQNEKWKHDKYEQLSERNPVNEEEQISKIEALLAS